MKLWTPFAAGLLFGTLMLPVAAHAKGTITQWGDDWVWVVDNKVGIRLNEMPPIGSFGAREGIFTKDMAIFFAFDVLPAKTAATTQPAQAIADQIKNTPDDVMIDGTLSVEPSDRYTTQMRYTAQTCGGKLQSLDRTRKLGDVLLHCVVQVMKEHPSPDETALADKMSAAYLSSATLYTNQEPSHAKPTGKPAALASGTSSAAVTAIAADGTAATATPLSQKDQWAAAALAVAEQRKANGQTLDAIDKLQHLIDAYPASPAAADARTLLKTYQADAPPAATADAATTRPTASVPPPVDPATKARSLLMLANNYLTAGRADLAREKYRTILKRYPQTPAATIARQKIAELDQANP